MQRLYGRVAARLAPLLSFSVAATNEITEKRGLYKSIGYTEGARRWLEKAGEWRQESVRNIRFGIE